MNLNKQEVQLNSLADFQGNILLFAFYTGEFMFYLFIQVCFIFNVFLTFINRCINLF